MELDTEAVGAAHIFVPRVAVWKAVSDLVQAGLVSVIEELAAAAAAVARP